MLFAFDFLCIFFFLSISCMCIKERRRNTQLCKLKHHHFAMLKHTYVVHDWQVLVVRWLFMPFFQGFLVLPVKKSDMSVSIKDHLIVLITNTSHKAHLLSCALRCSSKLQEIQSLENFASIAMYTSTNTQTHTIFYFYDFLFIYFFYEKKK